LPRNLYHPRFDGKCTRRILAFEKNDAMEIVRKMGDEGHWVWWEDEFNNVESEVESIRGETGNNHIHAINNLESLSCPQGGEEEEVSNINVWIVNAQGATARPSIKSWMIKVSRQALSKFIWCTNNNPSSAVLGIDKIFGDCLTVVDMRQSWWSWLWGSDTYVDDLCLRRNQKVYRRRDVVQDISPYP